MSDEKLHLATDYYLCAICKQHHHIECVCPPLNYIPNLDVLPLRDTQKPWCAYCNAFIEGNGWHLKSECPDGKIGSKKLQEAIEKVKYKPKEESPRIEMSPAYMQHSINELQDSINELNKLVNALTVTTNNLYEMCDDLQKRVLTIDKFLDNNYKEDIGNLVEDYKKLYIAKTELYMEHTKRHQENKGRIQELEYRLDRQFTNQAERIGILGNALHSLSEENQTLRNLVSLKKDVTTCTESGISFNDKGECVYPVTHNCPNCNGAGKNLYYSPTAKDGELMLACVLCQGKGIVWA